MGGNVNQNMEKPAAQLEDRPSHNQKDQAKDQKKYNQAVAQVIKSGGQLENRQGVAGRGLGLFRTGHSGKFSPAHKQIVNKENKNWGKG